MELNKIAAAILLAGLIGMITGKVAGFLYGGAEDVHHGEEREVARGYSIDVPENLDALTKAEPKEEKLPSVIPLLANADVSSGEAYFAKKCALCHTVEEGGRNKTGPNLWGIINRDKGSHPDFGYSKAMAEADGVWDYADLNGFLHKPKKWMPGTIMAFAGIREVEDRAEVIAYMRSLSSSPAPIPDDVPSADVPEDATLEDEAVGLPAAATEGDATSVINDEEVMSTDDIVEGDEPEGNLDDGEPTPNAE